MIDLHKEVDMQTAGILFNDYPFILREGKANNTTKILTVITKSFMAFKNIVRFTLAFSMTVPLTGNDVSSRSAATGHSTLIDFLFCTLVILTHFSAALFIVLGS